MPTKRKPIGSTSNSSRKQHYLPSSKGSKGTKRKHVVLPSFHFLMIQEEVTVLDIDEPSPKRSFVRESSPEVDSQEEDELTMFTNDLWESPINKAMATTLRNVETPVRNNIISRRREELARQPPIARQPPPEETSIDSTTSSEPFLPMDPSLQAKPNLSSSRQFGLTMDLSPARSDLNFIQTSTPAEELSDLDEPMEPPVFHLSDHDRMISIKEGTLLRGENSGKRKQFGRRKRLRWNIQDAPESKRGQWSILFEAARLDFVQKGPDNISSLEHDGKGRRRTADDEETRLMVTKRYKQIFGEDEIPMTKMQMDAVLSPLAF
jgi:hypothetical protein